MLDRLINLNVVDCQENYWRKTYEQGYFNSFMTCVFYIAKVYAYNSHEIYFRMM
jgi:hypothetical protein